MPNHPKLIALAVMLAVPGRAFALEDSYLPADKIPYVAEVPDQPHRLGHCGASGPRVRQARC